MQIIEVMAITAPIDMSMPAVIRIRVKPMATIPVRGRFLEQGHQVVHSQEAGVGDRQGDPDGDQQADQNESSNGTDRHDDTSATFWVLGLGYRSNMR